MSFVSAGLIAVAEMPWMLGTPRDVDQQLSAEDVSAVAPLLVAGIAAAVAPKTFTKAIGPRDLVDALINHWVAYQNEHGVPVEGLSPFMTSTVAYATRLTLPPPSPATSRFRVELATADDLESLVPLNLAFIAHALPGSESTDEARVRRMLRINIELERVWVSRVDGQVVGFCLVGRVTPRTIAIRNVFVAASHRRQGIAEALTRAMTRFYLGVKPLGFEGAPLDEPMGGAKEEICLNVEDEVAERVYKRAGFLLDANEPGTGKRGWFPSAYRGVKYLEQLDN